MKLLPTFLISLFVLFTLNAAIAQEVKEPIKMQSKWSSDNEEMRMLLDFEGIDYYQIAFIHPALKDKKFHLSVKEIWNGVVKTDSTIINSAEIGIQELEMVNDTILPITVLGKQLAGNKLKMSFRFPRFGVTREFDSSDSNDYSLRNVVEESGVTMQFGEKFYLFAYITPYERPDGSKSWCDVAAGGTDLENWGKKFNIEHYLVFEMEFE